VLRTPVPNAPFPLIWHPWRRMSLASAESFSFRVLVAMQGVPLHARNKSVAQAILGTACANVELPTPDAVPANDEREFFVAAWCRHPTLVPEEKEIFVPEPGVRLPGNTLAIEAGEVIHNKLPGLRYLIRLQIVEYQDWPTPPPSSGDDGSHVRRGDNDEDVPDDSNFNRRHPVLDTGVGAYTGPGFWTYRRSTNGRGPRLGGRRRMTFTPRCTILIGNVPCPIPPATQLHKLITTDAVAVEAHRLKHQPARILPTWTVPGPSTRPTLAGWR
jgi:hypothetical protein